MFDRARDLKLTGYTGCSDVNKTAKRPRHRLFYQKCILSPCLLQKWSDRALKMADGC